MTPAPHVEVVAVGTELVTGAQIDTTSGWLSARLLELGMRVARHTTVGDDDGELDDVLGEAARRSDVVVVTGGLGPTPDDRTRFAVARVAGRPLVRRPELVDALRTRFAARRRPMPPSNLVQADLPAGARSLAAVGTAAGFVVEVAGAEVWCLPGVPGELMAMAERDLLPALATRAGPRASRIRTVRTTGLGESTVADLLADLDVAADVDVAFLAARGEVLVKLTATGRDLADAAGRVDPVLDEVVARLGSAVTALDDDGLEHAVHRLLAARAWTLGLAESVTAGAVAARLASVPGASETLAGSLVVYATAAKTALAGIDPGLLARAGPVSAEVVAALAVAARDRLAAQVGAAVVGVAGPSTQGGEPVGRVRVATALPGAQADVQTLDLPGLDRSDVCERAVAATLDGIRRALV